MPPRNSNTKIFKRYRRSGTEPINTEDYIKIENTVSILENNAINNSFNKSFKEYKEKNLLKGKDADSVLKPIMKKGGDKRYADKQWYKDKEGV